MGGEQWRTGRRARRRWSSGCRPDHRADPSCRHLRFAAVTPALYFSPSCSKCRTAQSILDEHHVEAQVVRYLDVPPTQQELKRLMALLGIDDPRQMMRTGEALYAELRLQDATRDELLDAIVAHPILLERPIFVCGDRAVIARPPERLLELL
ncbi:MAG TPA: arsenate reductase (glutaredoxin) [Acidimicrobiaceae bacterium]|nr:arsenate reductase (glutaredoxin) [Acidimicrobiaceae bacterium]